MSTDNIVAEARLMFCASCGKSELDNIKLMDCDACDLVRYCSDQCKEHHLPQHESLCKKRVNTMPSRKMAKGHVKKKKAAAAAAAAVKPENQEEMLDSLQSSAKEADAILDGLAAAEMRALNANNELSESLKELKDKTERLKEELIDAQMHLSMTNEVKKARERCDDSSSVECTHGYAHLPDDHICVQFLNTFLREYHFANERNGGKFVESYKEGLHNTIHANNGLWRGMSNSIRIEWINSFFIFKGTEWLLKGNREAARSAAANARYFIELFSETGMNFTKICQLHHPQCDDHTVVKFFRRRIPCSCLDGVYEEVKHIPKLGICYNQECKLHWELSMERSLFLDCTRCRRTCYCSQECQISDWPLHKENCDRAVARAKKGRMIPGKVNVE